MVAPHYMVAGRNHHFKQINLLTRFAGSLGKGPIQVEDDVWIGTNCIITDGVRICKNAVIAANNVITKVGSLVERFTEKMGTV